MAKDLNKVQIIGRLGADPEPRYTPQGTAVTTMRVAAGRQWTGADGQRQEETEWFSVVAWEKLAEICAKYLTKGTRVYIEGRLQTRSWQGDDGQTRYKTEVVASDMIILDSRRESQADPDDAPAPAPRATPTKAPARPPAPRPVPRPQPINEEDLPF